MKAFKAQRVQASGLWPSGRWLLAASLSILGEAGTRGWSHPDAAGGLGPAIKTHAFQVPVRAVPAPVPLAGLDATFTVSAVPLRCEGTAMAWLKGLWLLTRANKSTEGPGGSVTLSSRTGVQNGFFQETA